MQGNGNICPTITAENNEVMRMEVIAVDEQNMNLRYETFGTLTTDGSSPKHNNRVMEVYELSDKGCSYVLSPKRGMCTDINPDVAQTVTSKGQNNWTGSFVSKDIKTIEREKTIGGVQPTKIINNDGSVDYYGGGKLEKKYRIRKLTPRECGRLMGVDDESITKMLETNSNSQCYKQFGNSIVVDVLAAQFSQLGISGVDKWNDTH